MSNSEAGDIYGDQCADTEGDGWKTHESELNWAIELLNGAKPVMPPGSPLMQQAADNAFIPTRSTVDQSGSVTYRAEDIMKIFDELASLKAQNAVLLAELTELKRTRPRQTIVDHFLAMPRSALRGGNGIPLSPL